MLSIAACHGIGVTEAVAAHSMCIAELVVERHEV